MAAYLVRAGDPPPGRGGEFEEEVLQKLVARLSERFILVGSLSLPTRSSYFYEYDIVVLSEFVCEVLEVKLAYPVVDVYEDWLECSDGFRFSAVFLLSVARMARH